MADEWISMTDKITWVNPPEKKVYDWVAIAETLRSRPNEWALIFEHDRASLVSAIRNGGIVALTGDKGFQIKTRRNDRTGDVRMCDLYLRYVPENDVALHPRSKRRHKKEK